jgi:hypothetical protein
VGLVAEGRAIPAKRPFRGFRMPKGPVSTRLSDELQKMRDEEYDD